jgi:hypothetical protein
MRLPVSWRLGFPMASTPPQGNLLRALANADLRESIKRAGVILGVDVHNPENRSLFFGKRTLAGGIRTGRTKELEVLALPVDFRTDDVEALSAACLALKGSCCYNESDGEPGTIDPALN